MARQTKNLRPRVDPVQLSGLEDGDADTLEAHDAYDGLRFTEADLTGRDLAGASFSECEFVDLLAHETELRASRFTDVRFERLSAPILLAARSTLRDVEVRNSRLGSVELYESGWQSVHFVNCKLGYVNLRGAHLHDVLFTGCTIDELDLGSADAQRLAFTSTRVDTLDLTRATLADVDLRDAELHQITGLEGLRGSTMNPFQVSALAEMFAAQLGVSVQD
ncbi:pentapeptide repeat-containing protein [Herbiconiux sp. 11R-BC]|uniref:pentapeptide repeat-containing protein n=1 Tax=Herbiconiux sp. 11R-BC TaxID=3111637 RepID=UPI003C0613ED